MSRCQPRQTSAQAMENVLDQIEDDNQGHDGSGVHSQAGRGLRFYSQRVCDRVQAKGATTYNELVHELSGGQPGEHVEDVGQEPSGQENIRRRVYDALNVLEALGIISMDKKEIQWIGVENSKVLNETTKRAGIASQSQNHRRELDEESEEPEDDDMDIEQLQREVDALRLRNELERAQLQDQVSRRVQLDNLVARNKLREAKEQERHERRKQKKLQREDRARGADGDDSGCNPDNMEPAEEKKKKSERRRHRSPRHRPEEGGHGEEDEEEEEEGGEDPHAHEGETKEERRARKEARRERRERKEKRAQRRQERESAAMLEEGEKIQMPFVVVRIPRYAGQSSDSEASISVVRRIREARPKKSSKAKRQEETTMVEIQIPHQEELCIISDTEILGDLGLGTVSMSELKTMLPKDLLGNARYVTNPGNVTVHGGFERQVVCSH
ncbi:Transcription factor Dp-2 [Podila minutissima]|uniref:Transcription factor Dp-2 n=1 Tax=Podila minutissima TaxID=64525 RepID=A0A9P5S8T8_9FUNG|nr:Transcription factor Dp-2 [Podila minutissima]